MQNATIKKIVLIKQVLEKEHPQGTREIAYTLAASGLISKTKKEFDSIEYACRKARWLGKIPLDWIADESRFDYVIPPYGYEGIEDFLTTVKDSIEAYELDFWSTQDNYFEIGIEKLGLAHFYKPLCEKYYARLVPTKGDDSYSQEYKICQRFKKWLNLGKKCYFLYLGDFNYKGYSIPKAIERNIMHFGNFRKGDIQFIRIALNFKHILQYPELPYNPNPEGSLSHKTMKNDFLIECESHGIVGDKNIELEALKVHYPKEHLTEVEKVICNLLDLDAWSTMKELSERDKEILKTKIIFKD